MIVRRTINADADITAMLRATRRMFGEAQVASYLSLLEATINLVADDPFRPSSRDETEFGAGVRSLHMQVAARRVGAAAHVVFYKPLPGDVVVIVRVLHQAMEPGPRLEAAMRRYAALRR